jgi:hypothetical protein
MTKHDLEAGGPRADRPKRRHFSAAYKLQIVAEYDAAPLGEKGAIRPHRTLAQAAPLRPLPDPISDRARITRLDVRRHDRLGGVLSQYSMQLDLAG